MSNPMGDRNLLLGILAWQKKFITDDVLVAAMNAWVQAKDKGLTQILREQKALTENQHALLEELVHDHLDRHGQDAKEGLAALSAVDPAKQVLAKIADPDVQASLAIVATAKPKVVTVAPVVVEAKEVPKAKSKKVSPIKAGAPKTPAKAPASGIPRWALLGGGLVAGGLVAMVVVASVVFAVVYTRDKTPVAQVKPGGDPAKPGEKLPLDPKDPKIIKPPIERRPGDRKPTEVIGDAEWRIEGNDLVAKNSGDKNAFLYFGNKKWTDYDLEFETSSTARDSGALAQVRATDSANHYVFSLGAAKGTKHTLSRVEKGTLIYDTPGFKDLFNLNQWYKVRIEARGDKIRCFVDGNQIFDYKNAAHAEGLVALGAPPDGHARWKNIKVTALGGEPLWEGPPEVARSEPAPDKPTPGFTALFNGKDLTGWKPHPEFKGNWRVEKGILRGTPTNNMAALLYTEGIQPKDFHLRVEVRFNEKAMGQLFFRCPDGDARGYIAPMLFGAGPERGVQVGRLTSLIPGKGPIPAINVPLIPFGQWFMLEIIAVGDHLTVKVDGNVTTDAVDSRKLSAGHVAIGQDFPNATIEVRRVEIKELEPAVVPPVVVKDGFVPLFNGRDMTGWKPHPQMPGKWRVENDILIGERDGLTPGKLYTERPRAKDFHLRVEAKISHTGSGGVRFRCPDGQIVGYEALINSSFPPIPRTGGLRACIPGKTFTLVNVEKSPVPPEQWFLLEILSQGRGLVVKVNGQITADLVDDSVDPAEGHIVLESGNGVIAFKKVEIKEGVQVAVKPPPPAEGFVSLFNGKDLTGWKRHTVFGGEWRVENGILIGAKGVRGSGRLYTERIQSRDFHLRVVARINDKGHGNVFFRSPEDSTFGYEAQFNAVSKAAAIAGLLMVQLPGDGGRAFPRNLDSIFRPVPGEWFTLEVIAKGDRLIVIVDGKERTNVVDPISLGAGHIGLTVHSAATIEFKTIEIKEFIVPAVPPVVAAPFPFDPAFVPLFNGKDLTGWKPHANLPGDWRVVNGILANHAKGTGFLFTARDDFKDYHLRLEARLKPGGGSSTALFRYTLDHQGYEALLFGRLTGLMNVRTLPGPVFVKSVKNVGMPTQEVLAGWIPMEIIAEGNRVRVKVNGVTCGDFTDNQNNFRSGHIGLHDLDQYAEFRRIEIKELAEVAVAPPAGAAPFPVEAGFVPLFNGKDMSGWKAGRPGPGNWRVINGVLTGSGPNMGELYTPRDDYGDFHLRVEARINDVGGSNIAFRYPYDPEQHEKTRSGGYTVRVIGRPNEFIKTGGFMVFEQVGARNFICKEQLMTADQWFNLEIIAQGNQVTTKINGRQAINFFNPKTHLVGGRLVLGFADFNKETVVEYRKIEIKEFKAVVAAPAAPPARPLEPFVPIFNGKDLTGWRVEGNNGWKVSPEGELLGQGPDTAILSKRLDFRNYVARVEMSASADVDGFFALRQNVDPKGKIVGLTSRLTGDGFNIRAGGAGVDGDRFESAPNQINLKPGKDFVLEVHTLHDELRVTVDGKVIGNFYYPPGRYPPGAIGMHLAKGSVRIKKFEISAEAPFGAPPAAAGEFVPLFNGKDLAGWQPHLQGAKNWSVDNGILTGAGEEAGVLHTTRADYKHYHLRMEARFTVPPDASSSILFRSQFGRSGYETGFADGKFTGGLYLNGKDFGKPVAAKIPANVKSGEWFTLDCIAHGNQITVKVNDKETIQFVDEEDHFKAGHIALRQAADCKLEFRKIDIKELKPEVIQAPLPPPLVKGNFVPLFNGKDLAGWQPHAKRPGNWRVDNGILTGSMPIGGALYSARGDYQDFHLRAEVRINDRGFGRILGRAAYDPNKIPFKVFGYEALVNQRALGDKTGTLTANSPANQIVTQAKELPTPLGEWFFVEMIVKGDFVVVKVNGVAVADFRDEKREFARNGHIALHQDANATLEFRKVEIMELGAGKEGAAAPAGKDGFLVSVPKANQGKWRVEGGELVHDKGQGPMSIYFGDPRWTDYDFTVDAMRLDGDNQFGLWFRRPHDDDGYFFGLGATKGTYHFAKRMQTGVNAPPTPILVENVKPIESDRWYTAKVSVRGDKANCYLDGVKLFEVKVDQFPAGSIGLRTWFTSYRFKNIKVTAPDGTILLEGLPDFAAAPPPVPPVVLLKGGEFVSLFNGKDLIGWKAFGAKNANWRVEDGILIGSGPVSSRLHSPRADYKNFHLRVEARVGDDSVGGVSVRAPYSSFKGYEAKINSNNQALSKTGSLEAHVPGNPINLIRVAQSPVPAGKWFTMDVLVKGSQITVLVNGIVTADYMDMDKDYASGHIALRQMGKSTIEFRKVEIKELPGS